jgi:hypothetical protein
MTLALLVTTLLLTAPDGGSPCPATHPRWVQFSEGERLFAQVKVGWSVERLRKLLGDPQSCVDATWTYSAGLPDGPLLHYRFRIDAGVVAHIDQSAAACIYRERQE